MVALVFLDTSVIRHSIPGARARTRDPVLQQEIGLLPQIAALARAKSIELVWHSEVFVEFASMALVRAPKPELLEAGAAFVPNPINYSRTITPVSLISNETWKDVQVHFFEGLREWPRYRELLRACGATPGTKKYENQLIDAFHLWCAESAGATHFLTNDFSLADVVARARPAAALKLTIVRPSELLAQVRSLARPGN